MCGALQESTSPRTVLDVPTDSSQALLCQAASTASSTVPAPANNSHVCAPTEGFLCRQTSFSHSCSTGRRPDEPKKRLKEGGSGSADSSTMSNYSSTSYMTCTCRFPVLLPTAAPPVSHPFPWSFCGWSPLASSTRPKGSTALAKGSTAAK